jgi:hypothetical protein
MIDGRASAGQAATLGGRTALARQRGVRRAAAVRRGSSAGCGAAALRRGSAAGAKNADPPSRPRRISLQVNAALAIAGWSASSGVQSEHVAGVSRSARVIDEP